MDISGLPHVFAPGKDVSVATGDTNFWPTQLYKTVTGTSEGERIAIFQNIGGIF